MPTFHATRSHSEETHDTLCSAIQKELQRYKYRAPPGAKNLLAVRLHCGQRFITFTQANSYASPNF